MLRNQFNDLINILRYNRSEITYRKHIKKIYNHLKIDSSSIDKNLVSEHKKYWNQVAKNVNEKWFIVYSYITANPDIRYVPENIYHNIIEEKLNNRKVAYAYRDKNFYEIYYDNKAIFPDCILRNIDGFFYADDYKFLNLDENSFLNLLSNYKNVLIKPSLESGSSKKIELFKKADRKFFNKQNELLTLQYLNKNYRGNFLIQDYIKQHKYFSQFNPSSVNTIRIFTYRSVINDEIKVLHTVLRIGKKGNFVDDQFFGGIACKINDDHLLYNYATDKFGNKYYESNGIKFSEVSEVPMIDEMKNLSVIIAKKNIHSRLMGFDFSVDALNNVKLIEVNNQYAGINFFQMNSSPVFGEYTDEIIEFCKS